MFGIFKPKRSAVGIGEYLADMLPQFLHLTRSQKIEQEIDDLVRFGAARQRVRAEFAVFNCFVSWTGMAAALQRGKIREPQFERMLEGFYQRLDELSRQEVLEPIVSVSYSEFGEYLHARIDDYINISITADNNSVGSVIVEKFCDYACDGERSPTLRMMILSNYILGSGTVYDMIAGSRLQ
jgi:hypothetical protein